MKKHLLLIACVVLVGGLFAFSQDVQAQVIDDTLIGGTTGTVSGGTFIADGWRVDGQYNYIYWHVSPTITHGAYEFNIRGLDVGCDGGQKAELSHMYDWEFNNSDTQYWNAYRENPYKHAVRQQCRTDGWHIDYKLEVLWKINDNHKEDDAGYLLTWDPNHTYHWWVEWEPDVTGNTNVKVLRDGIQVHSQNIIGIWNPPGHSVKIGSSLRPEPEGAYVGSVFSNFKMWDLSTPNIAEVTPDPDIAFVGFEYIEQLVLLSGGPSTLWSVLIGMPGMSVDGNALVSGWTPTVGEITPPLHTVQIKAQGGANFDTEQWQIKVKYLGDFDEDLDVDMEDFGKFQACYSGDGVLRETVCEEKDFDGDLDVDLVDFSQFQQCMAGANQTPNCP